MHEPLHPLCGTAGPAVESFYKLSSKYLGMPNISVVAGIPVHTLFMSWCLNSEGNVLTVNYSGLSSGSHGATLLYLQSTASDGMGEPQSYGTPLSSFWLTGAGVHVSMVNVFHSRCFPMKENVSVVSPSSFPLHSYHCPLLAFVCPQTKISVWVLLPPRATLLKGTPCGSIAHWKLRGVTAGTSRWLGSSTARRWPGLTPVGCWFGRRNMKRELAWGSSMHSSKATQFTSSPSMRWGWRTVGPTTAPFWR